MKKILILIVCACAIVALVRTKPNAKSRTAAEAPDLEKVAASASIAALPAPQPVATPEEFRKLEPTATIEDEKSKMRALSDADLKKVVSHLESRFRRERWIERANSGALDNAQVRRLGEMINERSAAQILLMERSLTQLERDRS